MRSTLKIGTAIRSLLRISYSCGCRDYARCVIRTEAARQTAIDLIASGRWIVEGELNEFGEFVESDVSRAARSA